MGRKIIDIHTHIAFYKLYSQEFLESIENSLKKSFANKEDQEVPTALIHRLCLSTLNDGDCSKMINQMDEAGIQKAVLLIIDFGHAFKETVFSIEDVFDAYRRVLEKHKDRFIVFAGIDPRRGKDGACLLERGIKEYGFKGLKLYPPCGFEMNDPSLDIYYEICNKYKIPVLIHTGPSIEEMGGEEKYPESILEVSKKYPNISFVLAHAAIKNYETGLEVAKNRENVYLDISSFQTELEQGDLWKEKIRVLMSEVPEKILFGTDWPMFVLKGNQKRWVEEINSLDFLSEEQLDAIFYKNASKILGMEGVN